MPPHPCSESRHRVRLTMHGRPTKRRFGLSPLEHWRRLGWAVAIYAVALLLTLKGWSLSYNATHPIHTCFKHPD